MLESLLEILRTFLMSDRDDLPPWKEKRYASRDGKLWVERQNRRDTDRKKASDLVLSRS